MAIRYTFEWWATGLDNRIGEQNMAFTLFALTAISAFFCVLISHMFDMKRDIKELREETTLLQTKAKEDSALIQKLMIQVNALDMTLEELESGMVDMELDEFMNMTKVSEDDWQ